MRWVAWTAFSTLPEVVLEIILLLSVGESLQGHPNLIFSLPGWISLMTLATVDFPRPVWEDIYLVERPDSERKRILALAEEGMDFIMK